jgi:predicted nucleotidyltransferase
MKTLIEITATIERLKPRLSLEYGVETIGVFGSYRRGEQTQKSDVDILVTFRKDAHPGFFKFLELEEFLEKELSIKVDLVSKGALKPYIGKHILEEVVMV